MLVAVLLCAQVAAQDLAEVHEVDVYDKDLKAGEMVTFRWLIYNKNTSSILVTVEGSPLSGDEWSATLSHTYFVIKPDESANVTLDVEATMAVEGMTVPFNVWLNETLAADPVIVESHQMNATVNFLAAPIVPEPENKILWFFDNPLPEPYNERWMTFIINILIWAGVAGLVMIRERA
jgi:hypothetical protein